MKAVPLLAGLAGLALAAWLLRHIGPAQVLALLEQMGIGGLLAIVGVHLLQVAASAAGWQAISAAPPARPSLATYAALRLVREGVNNLLPVAQIGGPVAAVRLLQRAGLALPRAVATTIADLTLEMVTQVLFTLSGLAVLLLTVGGGGVAVAAATGLLAACAVAACFVGAQWFGLGRVLEAVLPRLGSLLGWSGTGQVAGLHAALRACYARPRPVLLSAAWHMASWLLGAVEVCLALRCLGHAEGLGAGLVIESLGQALKAAGFAVPGALGLQEGGYIVLCGLFHLTPEVGIALSLAKRLREVALGLPGLALWHHLERRAPAGRQPSRTAATQDAAP